MIKALFKTNKIYRVKKVNCLSLRHFYHNFLTKKLKGKHVLHPRNIVCTLKLSLISFIFEKKP